jgi:hypothetical protein
MRDEITYSQFKILVNIFLQRKIKDFTLSELAKIIDTSPSNPIYTKVYKILIEKEIFIKIRDVGISSLYRINYKKLDDFIRDTSIFEEVGSFIIKSKPFDYNF